MKIKVKYGDIKNYLGQGLNKFKDDDDVLDCTWKASRPTVIEIDGYYTHFECGDLVDKEDLLKSLSVI